MNFWKKRFSRIISFLMANIMLLTVMPTELMADVLYSENAAVSVNWKPRENQVLFGGEGIIDLSVGVDTEKIQSAQVKISLTEKEAESFTQFEEINGVKTFSENGRTWKIVQDDDDSDKYLLTTDDIDSNVSQSFELSYSPADDTEESFDIDVTKEDVDVQYTAKETVNDTPAVVLPAIDEKKPVVDVPQEGEITEPDKSTDASKNEETLPDSSETTDENNDGNGETIEETPSADETTPSESTETTDETESTEESSSSEPSDEISASGEESQVTEAGNEIETQEIEYSDDVDESFGVDADEETAPIEISIDTEKLTFVKEMQKNPVVQSTVVAASDENVNWIKGSTNGNILFTATIPDSKKEQSFEFDFTNLKINSDVTLDGNTIMCGENKLVSLEGLKDTMRIDALKSSDDKISFKIIDDSESQTEENTEVTFTVYSNTLSADENAETAKIVLTAGDSQAVTDITLEELKTADTTGRVSLNETIFWVDNNNEEHIRPSSVAQPVLKYRIDDGEEVVLDENTADLAHKLAAVGLKVIPTVSYSSNGSSSGNTTVKCDNLPEKIISLGEDGEIIQQKINWYWQQPDVDGYTKETVDESNKDSLNVPSIGWYYVLNRSFTITTTVRDGYVGLIKNYFDETANKFSLYVSGTDKVIKLKEWKNVVRSEIVDGKFTTTVNDIPKYSLNGESLTYYMKLSANENTDENGVPYFSFADMETGDRIEVKYDNSSTHGFSNYEDAVYSGGEMALTLAGEVDFEAHKIWSDTEEDVRPSGRLTLWRYRTEEGYNTAAPAYNSVGTQYSIYFGNGSYPEQIAFTDVNGEKAVFPKYDALGHHYLYVVREEFDNGDSKGYEQLFGAYNEETKTYTDRVPSSEKEEPSESITENGKRADRANTYLYNNGTLYNKKIDNINAVVTKKWDAVSFQEEFKNIEVTVELQRRKKGSADEWKKIKSATLTGFSIVNLSKTASAVVPKRDADKNELEYRWVETGIRQNGTDIDFNSNGNGGIFVLTQGGRDIDYVSKASTVQSTNGDYNTTIINSTRDTVTYDVIKKWNGVPADGTELKFNIYQSTTGLNDTGSMTPYISFKMTKDGVEKTGGSERAEISAVEKAEGEWNHIRISNLPEFDLKGRQYEYIIDEEGVYGQSYSTKKIAPENINYETTVTNKVSPSAGLEKQILVEKKWVDDSDIIHRLPVNISVYDKNNKVIKNITLGEGNVWNQWVNIGQNDPDEVYILETSLGENGEHKVSELDGSEQVVTQPSYEGDSITEEEVSTDHHRYQVRYGKTDLNGNKLYIVSNNRLGNINIDAKKTWNDGDGHLRTQMKAVIDAYNQTAENPVALAMWLDFKSPKDTYKITHTDGADVANIGGDDVEIFGGADGVTDKTTTKSAVQPINIEADSENHSNRTQNFVFYNLPKYDINGEIVGYSVTEQWVVKTGNTYQKISSDLFNSISAEIDEKTVKLADIWAEYANTSSESYTVALDTEEASEVNLNDRQFIGIQNYRSETKNVTWHKIWQDEYSYNNGTRPDIHLLILSRNRNSDGSFLPTSKFVAQYSWKQSEMTEENERDELSRYHYTATIYNLPRYDSYGYEIKYYAVEATVIDVSNFDYTTAKYSVYKDGVLTPIGTSYADIDGNPYSQNDENVIIDPLWDGARSIGKYALVEGGTFTNSLDKKVKIVGSKIWKSLPSGWPVDDIPSATFVLDRYLGDKLDKEQVSTLKVTKWANKNSDGTYKFTIDKMGEYLYDGKNYIDANDISPDHGKLLPRYDESGRRYTYKLREINVNGSDGSELLQGQNGKDVYKATLGENLSHIVTNTYDSPKGSIKVKKIMTLPVGTDGKRIYPAVKFKLTRSYKTNDGSVKADSVFGEKYNVLTSAKVKEIYENTQSDDITGYVSFDNVDIYAPNGNEYIYSVEEIKTGFLENFETWAVKGESEKADVEKEENKEEKVLLPRQTAMQFPQHL